MLVLVAGAIGMESLAFHGLCWLMDGILLGLAILIVGRIAERDI